MKQSKDANSLPWGNTPMCNIFFAGGYPASKLPNLVDPDAGLLVADEYVDYAIWELCSRGRSMFSPYTQGACGINNFLDFDLRYKTK